MAKKKGVRTEHKCYGEFSVKWKRCRDVVSGQDAVHAARIAYLPKLHEQTNDDYKNYLMRAGFYNASWRTVAGLKGMMFRKPPKQELPAGIVSYLDNINLQGVSFNQFVEDVSCNVLEVGRIGLLVDYPKKILTDAVITVAVAEKMAMRPVIVAYNAENIINWKFRTINNVTVLALIVLKEEYEEPDGEFDIICEDRYRVLDLNEANIYRMRMFRIDDKGNDILVSEVYPEMNNSVMSFIPFVFITPDGTRGDCEDPPLIDLFNVNLAHYRVNADYEHGCHYTGLPTPWVAGYNQTINKETGQPDKLYIGSQTAWVFQDPQAKVGYLEFSGTGLGALEKNLEGKKQEMATLGARMLADSSRRQVETFGATAIKHDGENSILASIAINISQGIEIALGWFCEWSGQTGKIVYQINRKFLPVAIDAPMLTALMTMWQNGALSESEFFDLLKEGDLIAPEKTLEDHQGEIDDAPPPAPPSNTQPGELGTLTHDQKAQKAAEAAKLMPNKKVP